MVCHHSSISKNERSMLQLLSKVHWIAQNISNKPLSRGGIKENCFLLYKIFSENVRKKFTRQILIVKKKDSGWLFLINSLDILIFSFILAIYFGGPGRVLVEVGSYQ